MEVLLGSVLGRSVVKSQLGAQYYFFFQLSLHYDTRHLLCNAQFNKKVFFFGVIEGQVHFIQL